MLEVLQDVFGFGIAHGLQDNIFIQISSKKIGARISIKIFSPKSN
jgi:hypothetical protein